MKKRFLLIPTITLPLLITSLTVISYSSAKHCEVAQINANTNDITQADPTDVNNYSVVTPELTHYMVGERLDLSDLRVTYNDPKKGVIDVTSECNLTMQNGQELTQEGEFDVTIQHNNFKKSFKIFVEYEPHEIEGSSVIIPCGDITLRYSLMSNQECILNGYESGKGTLIIPDYVQFDGVKYFVKKLQSNFLDGENDVTGLEFKCKHLKKICAKAFEGTNCLDYYINHKNELLEFPEGLEEIGTQAFYGTDCGFHSIKGYSFPSTLKKIDWCAFSSSPFINGQNHNNGGDYYGMLCFRSIPEIDSYAFYFDDILHHNCSCIYGSTLDIANAVRYKLLKMKSFNKSDGFLVPKLIHNYETSQFTWGDITVKCVLIGDECKLISYVSGSGQLVIPDYVQHNEKAYYVNEIPYNWSDGENNITGLKFDCKHLKKICTKAFEGTNCLDYYINHKDELLEFPEGLEEIGESAFDNTDFEQNKIRGYSFPSTLKKINKFAFGRNTPHIDGADGDGTLAFRSIPEIDKDAFLVGSDTLNHNCKYVYGSSMEIANVIRDILANKVSSFFKVEGYLIPCLLGDKLEIIQPTWGDIKVECILTRDECQLLKYISGSGTLIVPDHVVGSDGKTYYVKQISSNWSDSENNITGLKFADDVSHLKKICDHAFEGTNCLDYYINHKDDLLVFPEGLEEIGNCAFYGTDYGQNKIKGYSFPSTLKKIGNKAFSKAPYIDGDDNNGELQFKSIPEIASDAFYICGIPEHDCKFISGSTQEIAEQMVKLIKDNMSDDFNTGSYYLIPQVVKK